MAMTMNGEVQLAATPETVWEKLNDPATLKACIPGCEQLDKLSDTEMQAVATVKIGPVKAKFKGKVTLSDLDPPHGYKISGQGDGGVAGFAKGGATVKLTPKDGGTLLSYDVDAQIGGKLAQLGQRLVNGAAKKVADDFFGELRGGCESQSRVGGDRQSQDRLSGGPPEQPTDHHFDRLAQIKSTDAGVRRGRDRFPSPGHRNESGLRNCWSRLRFRQRARPARCRCIPARRSAEPGCRRHRRCGPRDIVAQKQEMRPRRLPAQAQ